MNEFDTKAHAELLGEWRCRSQHAGQAFFPDGVIDHQKWREAPVKILFLNKEAHDSNNLGTSGFNLTDLIREELNWKSYGLTYRNTALWAYAIHEAVRLGFDGLPRWDHIHEDLNDEIDNAFRSCAISNIKKSGGRSVSNHADLKSYAANDGDLLRKQVDLINPDMVIAGGVWYLVKDWWPDCEPLYDSVYRHKNTIVIDFWHPANRAVEQMKYYALDAFLRGSRVLAEFRRTTV